MFECRELCIYYIEQTTDRNDRRKMDRRTLFQKPIFYSLHNFSLLSATFMLER